MFCCKNNVFLLTLLGANFLCELIPLLCGFLSAGQLIFMAVLLIHLSFVLFLHQLANSLDRLHLPGIMVLVFVTLDWMFILMNTTTTMPLKLVVSQRELIIKIFRVCALQLYTATTSSSHVHVTLSRPFVCHLVASF